MAWLPSNKIGLDPAVHHAKESMMSQARVLVGTRKGAFVLTSDAKRERLDPVVLSWRAGKYHLKGSPADARCDVPEAGWNASFDKLAEALATA
jgi:hypothetical protein